MIILVVCNTLMQCNAMTKKLVNCIIGGRTFGTLAGTGRPAGALVNCCLSVIWVVRQDDFHRNPNIRTEIIKLDN